MIHYPGGVLEAKRAGFWKGDYEPVAVRTRARALTRWDARPGAAAVSLTVVRALGRGRRGGGRQLTLRRPLAAGRVVYPRTRRRAGACGPAPDGRAYMKARQPLGRASIACSDHLLPSGSRK